DRAQRRPFLVFDLQCIGLARQSVGVRTDPVRAPAAQQDTCCISADQRRRGRDQGIQRLDEGLLGVEFIGQLSERVGSAIHVSLLRVSNDGERRPSPSGSSSDVDVSAISPTRSHSSHTSLAVTYPPTTRPKPTPLARSVRGALPSKK